MVCQLQCGQVLPAGVYFLQPARLGLNSINTPNLLSSSRWCDSCILLNAGHALLLLLLLLLLLPTGGGAGGG
jgi:hypothetical protein